MDEILDLASQNISSIEKPEIDIDDKYNKYINDISNLRFQLALFDVQNFIHCKL